MRGSRPFLVCLSTTVAVACAVTPACSRSADATADTDAGSTDSGHLIPPGPDDDSGPTANTGPALLSQAGLYSDFATRTVSADLFPYAPRYEFWADGATKSRWLYLPPGTTIDTSRIDDWVFPVGTKAFKEFRYDGKLVETRLLMKVKAGTGNDAWWQAAYVWKDDGSDAVATLEGASDAVGTTHRVPSQTDCFNCHGNVSDVLVGVSAIQLAHAPPALDGGAPDAGDGSAGGTEPTPALAALVAAGRLSSAPPPDIDVPGAGVVKDALGYLHANCGHCHNDEAVRLSTQTRMRLRLLVAQKTPEETGAFTTTLGTVMKHPLENGTVTDVVVKGAPDKSGLWLRMGRRDAFGMPPAGTQVVDETGVETIRQWIAAWQ